MIFAGTHLASFGGCKVVSWKNGIYTDFERKKITYRGRVVAAVDVPTIRTIEATVLVRAKDVENVDKKIDDIGKWLYDAGTAKLYAERDTGYYYLARCTSVSKPERSGISARFTVTFECVDYRLYSAYNDKPMESATSELSNFTFAGKHCLNDMGCVFVLDSIDVLGQAKINKYEIAGRSGTLRYDSGEGMIFEEKTLSGTLYFVKSSIDGLMSEEEISQKMHEVASWLGNSGREKLILDGDVSRYYEAEVESSQALSRKDWENGAIKLKMVLQPYSCSVKQYAKTQSFSLTAGTAAVIDISDLALGYATPLTVEITNKSSTAITDLRILYRNEKNELKTMRLRSNGFSVSNGQTLTVDGLSGDIKKSGTEGIKWLESGDFPIASANGTKQIQIISSTVASVSVTVKCYARWL